MEMNGNVRVKVCDECHQPLAAERRRSFDSEGENGGRSFPAHDGGERKGLARWLGAEVRRKVMKESRRQQRRRAALVLSGLAWSYAVGCSAYGLVRCGLVWSARAHEPMWGVGGEGTRRGDLRSVERCGVQG